MKKIVVWSFFSLLTSSDFPTWCCLQTRPRCWLLGYISLFYCCFSFCSGCPASVLVSEQTPICLKPHRRTIKKKKFIAVFLIPSNHNSDPQEVSAAITSSIPITPATSNFVVQRHHNDDPAFKWPSAHLLQLTPDHLRRPASPNPDPCQCCTAKSLHLVHHCRTKLWCRSNQSSPLFSREPHLGLHNLYCVLKFCCLCLLVTSGQGRHVSSLTKPAHQP